MSLSNAEWNVVQSRPHAIPARLPYARAIQQRAASMASEYVIGVDVGGTNTDAVILCGKEVVAAAKRPTEDNKTNGIVNAIRAALEEGLQAGLEKDKVIKNVSRVCIGTTHFVNAVVARDSSRLARVAVVRLCGSASRSLPPFCDFPDDLRDLICGGVHLVSGGFEYNLQSIEHLNEGELQKVAQEISHCNPPVNNVVISGLFSPHDDPSTNQEQQAANILQNECPQFTCTLSHKVSPFCKFTCTTITLYILSLRLVSWVCCNGRMQPF